MLVRSVGLFVLLMTFDPMNVEVVVMLVRSVGLFVLLMTFDPMNVEDDPY